MWATWSWTDSEDNSYHFPVHCTWHAKDEIRREKWSIQLQNKITERMGIAGCRMRLWELEHKCICIVLSRLIEQNLVKVNLKLFMWTKRPFRPANKKVVYCECEDFQSTWGPWTLNNFMWSKRHYCDLEDRKVKEELHVFDSCDNVFDISDLAASEVYSSK